MNKEIPVTQLTAWLLVAISAPILSSANSTGWFAVACSGLLCAGIILCRLWLSASPPKWIGFVEIIGILFYLGAIAPESATCWQDGIDTMFLPVVLLIAAACSVRGGATNGARCGSSLLWFVVPGICVILLAGVGDLTLPAMKPIDGSNLWTAAPLFLLPLLSSRKFEHRKKQYRSAALIILYALTVTVILNASQIPETAENGFYEYSKSVNLLGVAERFEAVSACLLTAGWFALFAFLLGAVYEIFEEMIKGYAERAIWICLIVVIAIMYKLPISADLAAILCVISWGILPLITQVVERLKNVKK